MKTYTLYIALLHIVVIAHAKQRKHAIRATQRRLLLNEHDDITVIGVNL